MPHVELQGIKHYYEDYGQGPVVLLLHHGFGSSEMWRGLLITLREGGYRLVMYDRRGYGRTEEGPEFVDWYRSDDFRGDQVDYLAAFCEHLGLSQVHLVGHCEGGVVALDAAAKLGGLVKSITVTSTLCHSEVDLVTFNARAFPQAWADLDPKIKNKMISWHGPERAERCWELFRVRGGEYGSDTFDLRPLLPQVAQPALIIYPDRSALFEVEQGLAFYRGLPNAELAVIPSCGHNTYDQKPQEYLRLVMSFLHRQEHGDDSGLLSMATCAG